MADETSSATGSSSLVKKLIPTSPSRNVKIGSRHLLDTIHIVRDASEALEQDEKNKIISEWKDLTVDGEVLKNTLDSSFSAPWKPKIRRRAQDFERKSKRMLYKATHTSGVAIARMMSQIDPPDWWKRQPPEIQALELKGRVKLLGPLCRGGYGDIWKGDWTDSGKTRQVGVKFLTLQSGVSEEKTIERPIRELRVWQRVDDPHILPLHGIIWVDSRPFPGLVSPLMENGDLHEYLKRWPDTTILERLTLLCQVASGLQYLHNERMVHCDLKANNILVDQLGKKAYLSDFGLSRWLDGLEASMGPCVLSSRLTGPRRWMAPEICKSKPPVIKTFATDIYAFGGLMMEVLTGHLPYHLLTDEAVAALPKGTSPDRPQCDEPCSIGDVGRCIPVCDEHWEYMQECWSTEPESRPSAASLVGQLDRFKGQHL